MSNRKSRRKIQAGEAIHAIRERNRCVDAVSNILQGKPMDSVLTVCMNIAVDVAIQMGMSREEFIEGVKEFTSDQEGWE